MARWGFAVVAIHKSPRRDGGVGNNVSIRHYLGMVDADADDEALGKAVKWGNKFYPRDKGWGEHCFTVERVENLTDLDIQAEAPIP